MLSQHSLVSERLILFTNTILVLPHFFLPLTTRCFFILILDVDFKFILLTSFVFPLQLFKKAKAKGYKENDISAVYRAAAL